jgi:hypothetical protein
MTTKPHMSCECEDSAELRFRCLGKHFTEPSDHYRVPLCRTLCFVGGSEILAEWKRGGYVQGTLYAPTQLNLILSYLIYPP